MKILFGYIVTYGYLIGVLIIITVFQKKFNLKEETSRKLIHILVGFSWLIMVSFFNTTIHLIIPSLTFILINYLSYKKGIISSMEREDKKSKGTIYYALSFSILSLITYFHPEFLPFYGIGCLTMSLGDGLAPFIGSKFNRYQIGNTHKTFSGSLTIFLTCLLTSLIFNYFYTIGFSLIAYIVISTLATIFELLGGKYDNLTLPLGTALISFIFGVYL